MRPRPLADFIGTAALATWALSGAPVFSAHAAPCPDVEVVFARGTTEPPGVGDTGQAFVDSLRSQVGPKSVGVYPVDYPATTDFPTAVDGITDASTHIRTMAATCPNTKMVLGGFSQGAAVMGFVTDDVVPDGVSGLNIPPPMPPDIANHVAAVALFGKPSTRFMSAIGQPQVAIGPQYAAKTIDLCVPNDLICASDGTSFDAHNDYVEEGMADQAAVFAASHVKAMAAPSVPAAPPLPAAPPAPAAPPLPAAPPAPAAPPLPATLPVPAVPAPAAPPVPAAPPAPATPPAPAAVPVPVAPPPASATPPAPATPHVPPVPPLPTGSWLSIVNSLAGYT